MRVALLGAAVKRICLLFYMYYFNTRGEELPILIGYLTVIRNSIK